MAKKSVSKPIELSENSVLLPDHGIVVSMSLDPVEVKREPKPKDEQQNQNVALWGEDNLLPQDVIEKVQQDTELPALLDYKGRVLQGREVIAVELVWEESKGDFVQKRVNDDEINNFLNHRSFKRCWREACVDFTWFANVFTDLRKSKGLDKIAYLGTFDACWCRYGKANEKGIIEKLYVNPDWSTGKADSKETLPIHVIDPYNPSVVEDLKNNTELTRFCYPLNYPTPGSFYYPFSTWISYLNSDWFKLKLEIPKQKAKLMERMLSAKYMMKIPSGYFRLLHKDWDQKKKEEQDLIRKKKVKEWNEKLAGVDKSGTTIMFETDFIPGTDKPLPAFEITPIESAIKGGENLQDSQEASEHGRQSLNVDQTLVGDGPGKKSGGGSGSDKRIAFNIQVALLQPYRDVLLEPLYFIAEYNGWLEKHPNLRFKVEEIQLETLDKNHSTQKPVTN